MCRDHHNDYGSRPHLSHACQLPADLLLFSLARRLGCVSGRAAVKELFVALYYGRSWPAALRLMACMVTDRFSQRMRCGLQNLQIDLTADNE